jgi:hypothetical protein
VIEHSISRIIIGYKSEFFVRFFLFCSLDFKTLDQLGGAGMLQMGMLCIGDGKTCKTFVGISMDLKFF